MFDRAKPFLSYLKCSVVLVVACALGCGYTTLLQPQSHPVVRVTQVRYTMGTLMDLTVYARSEQEGRRLIDGAFAIAERLNQELSTWIPESPISVFNRQRGTTPTRVSADIYKIVERSRVLSGRTQGAFSITVRPLVDLWERAATRNSLPSAAELAKVKDLISPESLQVVSPDSIRKRHPEVMIETGGIGKGYAVDAMLTFLRDRGVSSAFINFGRSSIGVIGTPPGEQGWVVDVSLVEGHVDSRVWLRDETLSVSRARGNPFVVAGRSYAHIFDPATVAPVPVSRGAAVRGSSATDGEAYVKYLVIRGAPSPAIARQWLGARWMVREGERLESFPAFSTPVESPVSLSARE